MPRPRSRTIAEIVAIVPAFAVLVASCLDDLPPPTECPPPDTTASGDCGTTFDNFDFDTCFEDGLCCFDAEVSSCLLGERSQGCECAAGECLDDDEACYPPGDCPPAVRDEHGEEATCVRLPQGAIQGGPLLSEAQCLCGCSGCAAVCDGRGMVVGASVPEILTPEGYVQFQPIPISLDLTSQMPAAGRLGFYVRARGLGQLLLQVSAPAGGSDPVLYLLDKPLGSSLDFSDSLFFHGSPFLPAEPFTWSEAEEPPNLAVIAVAASDDLPTLMEIDCIVPFVVEP